MQCYCRTVGTIANDLSHNIERAGIVAPKKVFLE